MSIVVPTLREAGNIPGLTERIRVALAGTGIEWELLLMDDDSGDGSEAIVDGLARRLPVRMVVRRGLPRDLSLAVLEGIRQSRFDRVVVMDADLSHPPERIPRLLAALDAGCDMAIGSRYVSGGSFDRAWGWWRFLNSRVATWLARPLVKCSDPMTGFFATDRRRLSETSALRPVGYKIALELMVRGRFTVTEVPIDFSDRRFGDSKMNWRQQMNYLRHLRRLYQYKFGHPVRLLFFGLTGASGFVVDVAGYLCLQWLGVEHRLARAMSFWPAVTWNWWLNRNMTFSERRRRPRARQWGEFVAGSLLGFGVSWGSYTALTTWSDDFARQPLLAFVCGVGLGGIVNYLLASGYAYRRDAAPAGGDRRKTQPVSDH